MNGRFRHRGARHLRAAVAIAGLGALLSLPATGLGAVAAVQDDVLATVALDNVESRLSLVAESGVRVTRVDIFWSTVAQTKPRKATDPADPAYDWSVADAIFTGLKKRKIIPIVSVYSSPAWAAGGKTTPIGQAYNPNAPNAKMYGQFMKAVATRYNGKFRVAGKKLPKVSHYEIWNEPNLKAFFRSGTRTSIPKYVGLVKAAYPQIHAANKKAVVIAGVGGPRGKNGKGNLGARTWLNGIVKAKGVTFDAYSQHIYPSSAPNKKVKAFPSWSSIDEILKTLDKKKKGMPLYITEAGYTTAQTTFRDVMVTPRQQRGYLKQIFNLKQVKNPRVPVVVWFNLQDNANWPAGLLREDGVQKLSYTSFRSIARKAFTPAQRKQLAR
ncbi:MAG: polysaccharide biosynthesis protein PslG [Miltoncostaeaceae bacterium]|nr:polysaccharide biosynthesis protein PslG [Miltoncostaeaceae bacterium]